MTNRILSDPSEWQIPFRRNCNIHFVPQTKIHNSRDKSAPRPIQFRARISSGKKLYRLLIRNLPNTAVRVNFLLCFDRIYKTGVPGRFCWWRFIVAVRIRSGSVSCESLEEHSPPLMVISYNYQDNITILLRPEWIADVVYSKFTCSTRRNDLGGWAVSAINSVRHQFSRQASKARKKKANTNPDSRLSRFWASF